MAKKTQYSFISEVKDLAHVFICGVKWGKKTTFYARGQRGVTFLN